MNPYQDPKYEIRDNKLVNRQTGEEIPDDEPIFILRAKDVRAAGLLMSYANSCTDREHREAVSTRSAQFANWAQCHRDRMKEPDTKRTEDWTSAGVKPT